MKYITISRKSTKWTNKLLFIMATDRFYVGFISIITTDYTVWTLRRDELYKLGGNFFSVWVTTCKTHGLCIIFYFYKQCQLMKCSCWQWFERICSSVCLSVRQSVCTSKAFMYQIQRPVQVSWGCRQGQQHVLWLPTCPLRLQSASVTFLAKQNKTRSSRLFW